MFIDGTTPANTLTLVKGISQQLKSSGFNSVIATTALPRNEDSSFNTNRQSFNTLLKADVSGDFDAVADLATNANLEDETDTTYFNGDKTHLTEAGNLEAGNIIKAAYDSL